MPTISCDDCRMRFRSKEALIKHKEKFCEASESIYSNPVLLKRQLQQELALSLENDDGRKKALLAKQSITATSLSFDEVRNFLVNGQGDNLLGKVSLGEVRRKFQANESDLEADRARALQNLQQERNQHLNDLKDDSKEARKEKLQAEEKLLERIRALEEARSKEMEARVAKTRVQKSLQGIAKPQLELLEKEKKQQMDLLMKEREALERREDEIKESIQKMEKRLLREYTHAEQLKREQAEFERAQKMGIQGINVDGLTAQLRDKAKAHDGDIARLEEERETLRLKQSSLFQRLSSLPNQAEIVSMQPQEVDHFLSNLKDKTTHQDMVLMQMQAEKKRQRDRENRLLKQAYQFDSNGNFMQELNHDGNSISSSKSNDSGLIGGSGDGVGGDGGAHSRKTPPQYGRRSSLGGNVGSNNHLSSSKSTSALLGGLQSITGSNGNGSSTNIGTDANVNRTVRSGRRRYSINTMKGGIESTPAPGSGRNSGRKMGRRSQSLATFSVGEGEPNSGLRGRARERMTRNGHHPISNLTSGRPNATGNAFTTPQRSSMPLQNNYSVNGNNDNSNNNNNNNYSISDNPLWQEIQDLKREYERSGGQNSNLLAQIQQLERDMQSLPLPHHSNNQPSHIHNSAQDHQSYNAVAGVAPGMSTQAQAYIGRGGSIEQQLRQQNQLLVQQRLENTRMTQYLEETAMRAERSRVMDQRAGFEKNMMALNYRLNRVFSGKGPGRSMGRSGDDIDDDGEQGEGGGKGRGKTFSDDPVLRAYEKLQCLPKDSPLYQMEMSHVLSMTKLRYEQELLDKKHQLEKKKLEMARIKAEEQGERKHQEEAARHKRQIEINKLQLLEQQTNPVLIAQRELAKQQQAMMMANGGHMANNAAVNDNGAAYSMGMGANARANVNGRSVNAMNANNNYGATSEHAHLHPMIPHLQSMQPSRQKGTVAMIDAPYQPKKGFVFFVDYVVGINNKYSKIENGRVRLVYRLYNDAKSIPKQEFNRSKNTLVKHSQLPSPPSPSAPETGPARPTTYSITKAKTVFENVSANPKYKMIVEVQLIKPAQSKPTTPSSTSSSQSANDKPTVISLGWTAVQLFRPVPAGENGNRKSNSKKKSKHDKKGRTNSTDSNDRSRETRNSDNENDDHSADAGDGGDNAILASGAFVLPLFKRPMKLETSPFKLMGDTMHLPTQGAHQPLKKLKLYVRILPFALGTSLMPNRNPAKTMSQYYPFVAVPSVLSRFLAMMKNMKAIAADSSDDDSDEEDDEDEEEVEEHDEVDGDGNGGNEEKYRDQASDNEEDADGDSGDDDGDDQARKGSGFDDDGNGEFGGGKRLKRRSHSLKVTAGQVNTVTGIVEYTKKGKKKKKKNTQAEEEEEKKRERDAVAEEMSKAKPSKSFSSFGLVMDHWEQEAFSIGEFSRVKATIYTPQTNRTTGANRAMTGVFGLDGDDSKVDFDNDNDIGNDDSSRNMNNNRYNDNENDNNDIDVGPAVRKFLPTRNDKTGRVIEWYTPYAQLGVGGELGITQWKKQAVLKRVPITEDTWMVLEIMQMLGEAGKVKKRIMKKKYSEEVPSGWCAFPLFQDLTGDDHDNGSDGEENRTRVSTGSYALRVFKHPIALGNLQHGQYEASFPCTISSSGAGGDDAESKYDRKESTTLGLALEPLGETLSMTLFDKYNIPDKVNIPLMKTEKIKQNISWLQSLTHRPSKQSVKRFDGFDIYVDQCRFLPMNTALSRVTLRLYTAHNAKQSQFLMVSKGEWEFNDLHSHIERPEYRFRCEFRGDKYLLYPSLIAVFTVSCLDRFDGTMKVIGETGLNIYNQKGTLTPHPPATLVEVKKRQALFEASRRKRNANVGGSDSGGVNAGGGREENANSKKESNIGGHHLSDTDLDSLIDSTISLNTGCFQLPLYAQRNYSKELTVASYKRLKRLPCATMLVRIVRPAKDRDGRALSTTTVPPAEWANAGLISEPPQYWTGAYDSSKCIPTGPEQKLYNTLNKCKPTRVIDVIPEFLDENMMYHRFVKATTEADDAKNGGKGGGKGRGSRNRPLVKLDMTNDMALDDWMRNMLLLANHKVPYTISSQQKIHGQLRHDKLVLYPLLSPHYPYVSSRGFRVSVDGVHLIDDSDVVVTVLTSLNPPASYYQQVPLTAGVHMTDKYNWNSYQKSPQFRSGFQHFKDVPFNENTVLIIDVRQVKRPDILVKNKFADPDAYVERTSTGMRRRHVHTGGNAADELRQKLESQPTSLGWTILPVFKKASDSQGGLRYVNTGNFQLPLFEGKPDRVLLNHMLQESPIAVMKKSQARRGSAQLRIKEWTSVFVRLVDEGRFELLPKHGPAHADKSFLDTRKLDKYKYDPKSLSRSGFFGWSKAPTLGERILKVDTDEVFPLLTKDRKTVNDEEDLDADVDGDSEGHGEKETMKGKGQFALFESRLVAAFKESLGL